MNEEEMREVLGSCEDEVPANIKLAGYRGPYRPRKNVPNMTDLRERAGSRARREYQSSGHHHVGRPSKTNVVPLFPEKVAPPPAESGAQLVATAPIFDLTPENFRAR